MINQFSSTQFTQSKPYITISTVFILQVFQKHPFQFFVDWPKETSNFPIISIPVRVFLFGIGQ